MKIFIIVLKVLCLIFIIAMFCVSAIGLWGLITNDLEYDEGNKKRKVKWIITIIAGIVLTLVGFYGYRKCRNMSYTVYIETLPQFEVTLEDTDGTSELSWESCDGATRYEVLMIDVDEEYTIHGHIVRSENVTDVPNLKLGTDGNFNLPSGHTYAVYVLAGTSERDVTFFNPYDRYDSLNSELSRWMSDNSSKFLAVGKLNGTYTAE